MMPALGRGIQNFYIQWNIDKMPNIDVTFSLYITEFVIVGMLILAAWRFKKLLHPATFLAVGVNMFNFLIEPIGRSEGVQLFLKAFVKG